MGTVWKDFKILYERNKVADPARSAYIFSDYWFPAAHLGLYVATPLQLKVLAVGSLTDIHHFAWLNPRTGFPPPGADCYFVTVSNYFKPPSKALAQYFKEVSCSDTIPQYRNGMLVRKFYIYNLRGYTGGIPASGILIP